MVFYRLEGRSNWFSFSTLAEMLHIGDTFLAFDFSSCFKASNVVIFLKLSSLRLVLFDVLKVLITRGLNGLKFVRDGCI